MLARDVNYTLLRQMDETRQHLLRLEETQVELGRLDGESEFDDTMSEGSSAAEIDVVMEAHPMENMRRQQEHRQQQRQADAEVVIHDQPGQPIPPPPPAQPDQPPPQPPALPPPPQPAQPAQPVQPTQQQQRKRQSADQAAVAEAMELITRAPMSSTPRRKRKTTTVTM